MILQLLSVFMFCSFSTTSAERLTSNNLQIIGGRNTTIDKHPYQVAVSLFGEFWCSGVVLNHQWVLTTASCVSGMEYNPTEVIVRAQSDHYNTGGVYFTCASVIINENFNFMEQDYDIAVLKINGEFTFGKKLKPIKLGSKRLKVGKMAVISGWGATNTSAADSDVLKEVDVTILKSKTCGKAYSSYTMTNRMFCAGSKDYGPCWGDDADPLIVNNRLYGLLSFNDGCFKTYYPSVYSNIPSLRKWIQSTIKNNTR